MDGGNGPAHVGLEGDWLVVCADKTARAMDQWKYPGIRGLQLGRGPLALAETFKRKFGLKRMPLGLGPLRNSHFKTWTRGFKVKVFETAVF